MRNAFRVATAALFMLAAGCGTSDTPSQPLPAPVASVTLTPSTLSLVAGGSATLTAMARDAAGNALSGRAITWSSSSPAVARVDATGGVIAVAPGTATITATSEGRSADVSVVVAAQGVPVASVTVGAPSDTIEVFDPAAMTAVVRDAEGNVLAGRTVTWISSNPAVATIDPLLGRITGVDRGTVTVTATSEGRTGSASIVVVIRYRSIVTGTMHACDIASGGVAWCWGLAGREGRLGDGRTGDTERSTAPVRVSGQLTFKSLSAFARHTCGITTDGRAYCWGYNGWGGLGAGQSANQVPTPVAVSGGLTFTAVAAGADHSCGVATDGRSYCWGYNADGQLGSGNTNPRDVPVAVTTTLAFTGVSAGSYNSCATTAAGVAHCWGTGAGGMLGGAPPAGGRATSPQPVGGAIAFREVSVGNLHACGVATDGRAFCWGTNGGRLGDGTTNDATTPQPVSGGMAFRTISAGYTHSCGITSDAAVWCWGFNRFGQLGVPAPGLAVAPVRVNGLAAAAEVSAAGVGTGSGGHTCAISADRHRVFCWGLNDVGQGGNGAVTPEATVNATPVLVQGQRPL